MIHVKKIATCAMIAAGLAVAMVPGAQADAISKFYKGKVVTLIVSAGGGTYTLIARTVARHMPKHLGGSPTMIVKNMPGAGHVRASNFMYTKAAKDGTYIATIGNSIPLHQAINGKGVRFDARKFNWLGSTGISNLMTAVWHKAGVNTIEDAKKTTVISGGTGSGSGTVVYPTLMNNILGTKFKIVIGYRRAGNIDLAMERGEVMARSGYSYGSLALRHPDWLRSNKVKLLVQVGLDRARGPAGVPLLVDLAKDKKQREIFKLFSGSVALGRPYLTTPGVPADRLAALRKAFAATIADPAFLKEQKKRKFDLFPTTWQAVSKSVNAIVGISPELVKKAKAAMKRRGTIKCKTFTDPKNCKNKKKKKKKKRS
jgi:tripartite-type tricarboxylate transporter receptor subunit TctC